MYEFQFHKEISKITRVIRFKGEVGNFVSVTVSKAGLFNQLSLMLNRH